VRSYSLVFLLVVTSHLTSGFTNLYSAEVPPRKDDPALVAPPVNTNPGKEYADETRLFQGIPGMEREPMDASGHSGMQGEQEKAN